MKADKGKPEQSKKKILQVKDKTINETEDVYAVLYRVIKNWCHSVWHWQENTFLCSFCKNFGVVWDINSYLSDMRSS